MMQITVFEFESFQVRFVGTPENPWWVAADVCAVLEITNTRNTYARLDDDEKDVRIVDTLGGKQEMVCINESGLYSLILTSRKPQAKRFKKWVTSEVLPSIRKTGQYSIGQQTPVPQPQLQQPTLIEINTVFAGLVELGIKPELIESAKLTAIAKSIPHLADVCEESKRLLSAQMAVAELPMSPTELGKIITQKLGGAKVITAQQVNQALMEAGLQVAQVRINKEGKKKTEWHLTEKGQDYGQMQMDTARGHGKTVFHPRWFSSVICVIQEQFGKTDFLSSQD